LVLLAVLLLAFRGEGAPEFSGSETLARLVRDSQTHESAAFGPAARTVGESGDGLLATGFSGFRVPDGLAGAALQGALVDKTGAGPVAVLRLATPGLRAVVFPAAEFGVGLPEDGTWSVFELAPDRGVPRLGVAVQAQGGVGFAVSSPDGIPAVRRWLSGHGIETD
jgi:hypothetical protein